MSERAGSGRSERHACSEHVWLRDASRSPGQGPGESPTWGEQEADLLWPWVPKHVCAVNQLGGCTTGPWHFQTLGHSHNLWPRGVSGLDRTSHLQEGPRVMRVRVPHQTSYSRHLGICESMADPWAGYLGREP